MPNGCLKAPLERVSACRGWSNLRYPPSLEHVDPPQATTVTVSYDAGDRAMSSRPRGA
jgi:hypothetical protein